MAWRAHGRAFADESSLLAGPGACAGKHGEPAVRSREPALCGGKPALRSGEAGLRGGEIDLRVVEEVVSSQ